MPHTLFQGYLGYPCLIPLFPLSAKVDTPYDSVPLATQRFKIL